MTDGYKTKRTPNILRYDKKSSKIAENVSSINVEEACANVNITITESKNISVYLHGTIDIYGNVNFESELQDDGTLLVNLNTTGVIHQNKLVLDIFIPVYKSLDNIFIKSSMNIFIDNGISAKNINITSISADALVYASFATASIHASDKIDVNVFAEQNISLDIATKYGDVTVNLGNIANINFTNLYNPKKSEFTCKEIINDFVPVAGGFVADLSYSLGTGKMTVC